jgi:hypothetical protein
LPRAARAQNCTEENTTFSTAESTAFASRVGAIFKSALPPAPKGWTRQESGPKPADGACGWLSRVWNVSYQAAPDAPGDSGNDWMTRYQEAMSRRDAKEIKRLVEERKQSQAQQSDRLMRSIAAAAADGTRKARASVSITVNRALDDLSIPNPKASSVSPPHAIQLASADLAFRSPDFMFGGTWHNGVTTVYLGKWKSHRTSYHLEQAVEMPKGKRDTKVHTVKIEIIADDKRAEELVSAFDWKALRALVEP